MPDIILTEQQTIDAMVLIVTHEVRRDKGGIAATFGGPKIRSDTTRYVQTYYPAGLRIAVAPGSAMHRTLVGAKIITQ